MAVKKLFLQLTMLSIILKIIEVLTRQRVHRTVYVVPVTPKVKDALHSEYLIQPTTLAIMQSLQLGNTQRITRSGFLQESCTFWEEGKHGIDGSRNILLKNLKKKTTWEYFYAMCHHFPQGFIITLLKSVGTLTFPLRGIMSHPEFSDTDLIRLNFQHVIFLIVNEK